MQENAYRLHADIILFHMRDVSIWRFCCLQQLLNQPVSDTKGWLCVPRLTFQNQHVHYYISHYNITHGKLSHHHSPCQFSFQVKKHPSLIRSVASAGRKPAAWRKNTHGRWLAALPMGHHAHDFSSTLLFLQSQSGGLGWWFGSPIA